MAAIRLTPFLCPVYDSESVFIYFDTEFNVYEILHRLKSYSCTKAFFFFFCFFFNGYYIPENENFYRNPIKVLVATQHRLKGARGTCTFHV